MEVYYIIIIFFLAGLVLELTGFGVATVSMSLLLFFLPPIIALPLVAIVSLFSSGLVASRIRNKSIVRKVIPLLAGVVFGVPLGMLLLNYLNPLALRVLVGVFLIAYSIYGLLNLKHPLRFHGNRKSGFAVGVVAGFFNASFNIDGPLVALYQSGDSGAEADDFKDTIATHMFFAGLFTVTGHFLAGRVNAQVLAYLPLAIPAIVIGFFVGRRIFAHWGRKSVKEAIYLLVLASGVSVLF